MRNRSINWSFFFLFFLLAGTLERRRKRSIDHFSFFSSFWQEHWKTTGKRNQWDSSEYATKKCGRKTKQKTQMVGLQWKFRYYLLSSACGSDPRRTRNPERKMSTPTRSTTCSFHDHKISTFHCPPLVCKNWLGFFFFLFQTTERQDRTCLLSFTILPILMQGRNLDHLAILKHSQTGEDNRIPIGIN